MEAIIVKLKNGTRSIIFADSVQDAGSFIRDMDVKKESGFQIIEHDAFMIENAQLLGDSNLIGFSFTEEEDDES